LPDGAAIYEPSSGGAFRQAEVLSGLKQIRRIISVETASIPVDLVNHPFAIIVSQDCDLDLDFKARNGLAGPEGKLVGPGKKLANILLCEVATAEELFGAGRGSGDINSTIWSHIKTNNDVRYHFFQGAEPTLDSAGIGLPELAVDFKRYFSIPTDDVYAQLDQPLDPDVAVKRRLRLKNPYCEHFCTRFSFFLSRIALPDPHFSSKGN
jgi:hypothetical protein